MQGLRGMERQMSNENPTVAEKLRACAAGPRAVRALGFQPESNENGTCGCNELIQTAFGVKREMAYEALYAIADAIDAEESEMRDFCVRVVDAASNEEELDVFGVAYTPLPTDVDGVPIRVGDMLQGRRCGGGWFEPFKVDRISLGRGGWSAQEKSGVRHPVGACRHYKLQTVEDVLCEFALACKDAGNSCPDVARIAAEYAAKLQLKKERDDG